MARPRNHYYKVSPDPLKERPTYDVIIWEELIICMFCNKDTAGKLYYRVGEKNICTPCLRKLNAILRIV